MKLTTTYTMGFAALIMGGSVLISRFMGLIRDKVISWNFGATSEADIYFASFIIPDFINYLLAGGYLSIILIPLLSTAFKDEQSNGWKFFSTVFSWATITIIFLTILGWIFAPQLAKITTPGFSAIEQERLTYFLRIILPAQIFFLPGACLSALLYIRKQFLVPALMPILYNSCIILFGIIFTKNGMEGFCWGVLLGSAIGAFFLPLWATKKTCLQLQISLKHPLMKRFLFLALPLMIGQSIVVLDEQLLKIFGSLTEEGTISLLNYARRIMLVPVGVIAQAASVASYPFLASLESKNNTPMFNQTLHTALQGTLVIALPITGWMIAIACPTLGFIFEGGQFTAIQSLKATPLLQIMLISVPFWVIHQIIGRAFYAKQNTWLPALLGTFSTAIFIPCFPVAIQYCGSSGIALLSTLAVVMYTLLILLMWSKQFGCDALKNIPSLVIKTIFLTTPCTLLTWYCVPILFIWLNTFTPFTMYIFVLFISTCIFTSSYLILLAIFSPNSLKKILLWLVYIYKK